MPFKNQAYLHNSALPIKDDRTPLLVTSCGYYRIDQPPALKVGRSKGRIDYQLLYIVAGKAYFRFNGKTFAVSPGEMVLYRPNEPQRYYYYPEDKCEVYWVHFTGYEVEKLLSDYDFPSDENIFTIGTSSDYQQLFEQIIIELKLCRKNYMQATSLLLRYLFLLVHRHRNELENTNTQLMDRIVKAVHYFNKSFTQDINIEEYAKSLYVTPCYFIRKFKQITKRSPLQYLLSLRISYAKTLLETSDFNISEIALAVGYSNPLYFSRIFTKNLGISPTEYRQQHKQLLPARFY